MPLFQTQFSLPCVCVFVSKKKNNNNNNKSQGIEATCVQAPLDCVLFLEHIIY